VVLRASLNGPYPFSVVNIPAILIQNPLQIGSGRKFLDSGNHHELPGGGLLRAKNIPNPFYAMDEAPMKGSLPNSKAQRLVCPQSYPASGA
jgi:hypothetical protein